MNSIRKNFLNRRVLSQYYYNFLDHIFLKSSETKKLIKDGFYIHNNKFPIEALSFKKYLNYENLNFVDERKKIDLNDLKKIYRYLNEMSIFKIIKEYLGKDLFCYDNSIFTLGTQKSFEGSWQPHHDSKGRRIKIYIWLDKLNYQTHPLYYKKSSHKNIINWNKYSDTRFPHEKGELEKIYGDLGDIIIFDTHGIHSNFKETTEPRSVVELTFEANGFLRRFNKKLFNTEFSRLGFINLNDLINE